MSEADTSGDSARKNTAELWLFLAPRPLLDYPKIANYARRGPAALGQVTRLARQFKDLADDGLVVGPPLPGGSSSLAFAGRLAGHDVVVKCHRRRDRAQREIQSLTLMAAAGCAPSVLGAKGNIIILERVRPGLPLRDSYPYPDSTLHDAGALLERIAACPLPRSRRRVEDYALNDVLRGPVGQHVRAMAAGESPGQVVVCDARRAADIIAAARAQRESITRLRLCHGDFHDYNLLSHASGWIAIDPRDLVVGDPHADVARLAVSVACRDARPVTEAVERICAGNQLLPQQCQIWTRLWALQVLGFLWGVGAGDSPDAATCRVMLD